MEYLKIKNWERHQHYKDRCPPWIKLHVKILNDLKFCSLSRASKCLLMLLWILASENDGFVPSDLTELKFRLRDDSISEDEINQLIKGGFLSNCKQVIVDDSKRYSETETETETDKKRKKFVPPNINEVIKFFIDNGYTKESAEKAFLYYSDGNPPWTDSRGKQVRGWKQKMRGVWFKPENKRVESAKPQKPIQAGDMSIYD